MLDPQVQALGQYQWYSQTAFPSAEYITRAPLALFDTTYKVREPAIRGVLQASYSAPSFVNKSNQAMPVSAAQQISLGALHGGAPSTGIYTGIPSGCSNGMGGNPYS